MRGPNDNMGSEPDEAKAIEPCSFLSAERIMASRSYREGQYLDLRLLNSFSAPL